MRIRTLAPILTVLTCLAVSGCKVTTEDIDYWMGTQKGPGKIVAVLLASKYDDDLRVYAGLSLVRMEPRPPSQGHDPIDGVAELQAAVRLLPEETRSRLVNLMAQNLVRIMRGEDTPAANEGEEAIPPLQIRAKDAAFLLYPYATGEAQETLRNAVVDWFATDFNGRNLAGNFSAEQVVRQLGAPAAGRLVNAMNARLPQQALVKVAELISVLGDRQTKEAAATRLVAIEREMEAESFMNWLRERLQTQLREQQGGAELDPAAVTAAATLNRENFITLGALPAMKHLNDQRVIQDRLLEMAQTTTVEGLDIGKVNERRVKALQAMEGGVRPDQVEAMLDLAINEETPIGVRDYAFDRIADSRSTSAIRRLWPVFSETEDWRVRWRVGSLILTLGGADVVQEFFTRLSAEAFAREELHGYGERLSQIRPPPTDYINGQLRSESWHDRCIALYFWERRAEQSDLASITALVGDTTATNGEHWEDQDTVGKVAQAVAGAVRERLGGNGGAAAGNEGDESDEGE